MAKVLFKEKTDRYTRVPDHLKGTGVELQYDANAALPSGRAEKPAGVRIRAEHRETGRQEMGSDNKDHIFPKRLPPPTVLSRQCSKVVQMPYFKATFRLKRCKASRKL
jgi:hypothetical protein